MWMPLLALTALAFVPAALGQVVCDTTHPKFDIVFVVDGSGSIRARNPPGDPPPYDNWDLTLKFIRNITDSLTIGEDETRVGLVTFSLGAHHIFYMKDLYTLPEIDSAIMATPYLGYTTNTQGGIHYAHRTQFTAAHGDREDVQNICIIITDGKSNIMRENTIPFAEQMHDDNIIVISIGITEGIDIDELREMSSPPHEEGRNYFRSGEFNFLQDIQGDVSAQIAKSCEVSANCTTADSHCAECQSESSLICQRCIEGYYKPGFFTNCQECTVEYCEECANDGSCAQCDPGYININDGEACGPTCTVSDTHCAECEVLDRTACASCVDNRYYLSEEGICTLCEAENCQECAADGNCMACNAGFYVHQETELCMELCTVVDANCARCDDDDPSECVECVDNRYYMEPESNSCMMCTLDNCHVCLGNNTCGECEAGYAVSRTGLCDILCTVRDPNCGECSVDDGTHCAACVDNLYYLDTSAECRECQVDECEQCAPDGRCAVCEAGMSANREGNCEPSCTVFDTNCAECNVNNTNLCSRCINNNFYLDSNSVCELCTIDNCDKCNVNGTCTNCNYGYFVNGTNSCQESCYRLDANCAECDTVDQTRCVVCAGSEFYLDEDQFCRLCEPDFCRECDIDGQCILCEEDYYVTSAGHCNTLCTVHDPLCGQCEAVVQSVCESCVNNTFYLDHDKVCQECTVNHCVECDQFGRCADCKRGYYINDDGGCTAKCTTTDDNCVECHGTAQHKCVTCADTENYYLDVDDVCTVCTVEFCETCNVMGACGTCEEGYFVNENQTCSELCTHRDENCATCVHTERTTCEECVSTDFYISDADGLCTACDQDNCFMCGGDGLCNLCDNGFWLNDEKICNELCTVLDDQCARCDDVDLSVCVACRNDSYYLNQDAVCELDCLSTRDHCVECQEDRGKCDRCQKGFYAHKGHCRVCGEDFCRQCNSNGTCAECKAGYFVNHAGHCHETCLTADGNATECDAEYPARSAICVENYFVNANYRCKQNCLLRDEHCTYCSDESMTHCAICEDGFYVPQNGEGRVCQECIEPNCSVCRHDGLCHECIQGFFVSDVHHCHINCKENYWLDESLDCQPNCLVTYNGTCSDCDISSQTECTACVNTKTHYLANGLCNECLEENCVRCNQAGTCALCEDDFYLDSGKHCQADCLLIDENCIECSVNRPGDCQLCVNNTFWIPEVEDGNDICELCVLPNCLACTLNGVCSECAEYYFLNRDSQCQEICTVADAHCVECQAGDPGTCTECDTLEYYLDVMANRCTPCARNNCIECRFDGKCKTCDAGYFVNEEGDCQEDCRTQDPHCIECAEGNDDVCIRCDTDAYYLSEETAVCTACNVTHCTRCGVDGLCEECVEGYFVNEGACTKTCTYRDDHCAECVEGDLATCQSCEGDGEYFLDQETGWCTNCDLDHCLACNDNGGCVNCEDPYFVNATSLCQWICTEADHNCVQCAENNPGKCVNCSTDGNFYLDTFSFCRECDTPHCLACDRNGGCINCEEHYFEDGLGGCDEKCTLTDDHCVECDLEFPAECVRCESNDYYLDSEFICQECARDHCSVCAQSGHCSECDDGYMVNVDGDCEQICTDIDEHCRRCVFSHPSRCEICREQSYYVNAENNHTCELCAGEHCARCSEDGMCLKCNNGFYVEEGQCVPLCWASDPECETCVEDNQKLCLECKAGHYLNARGNCKLCQAAHCTQCAQDGSCEICETGWTSRDGVCAEICTRTDRHCLECDPEDLTRCISCMGDYYVGGALGICHACTHSYCMACGPDGNCQQCFNGYFIAENGACVETCLRADENCAQCDDNNQTVCTLCADNFFYLSNATGICTECSPENCLECDVHGACTECHEDYFVRNGTCAELCTTADENCVDCSAEDLAQCVECSDAANYYLDEESHCELCDLDHCEQCDVTGVCVICEGSWTVMDGVCQSTECQVDNCYWCFPGDNYWCEHCDQNYYTNSLGQCVDDRFRCDNVEGCHADSSCTQDGFCECNDTKAGKDLCGDGVNDCKERCVCRVEGDPEVTTYDQQVILITGTHKYTLTKDMVNTTDPCSFNIELKVTSLIRAQRVAYAITMPRSLSIDILGYHIELQQDHMAKIGDDRLNVSTTAYEGDGFRIFDMIDPENPDENFITFDSSECDIRVGFYGDNLQSVAIIDVPCRYGGTRRMVGLCGNCDARLNDLTTLDGNDVSGESDMYELISKSYVVDTTIDDGHFEGQEVS